MDPDSYLLSQIFCAFSIDAPLGGVIVALVLALFLLFVIGFVSASEMSLFSLASSDLQSLDETSPQDKFIKTLLETPDRLLATVHVVNGLASIAVAILISFSLTELFSPDMAIVWSFVGVVVALSVILLLCGEILPKYWAYKDVLQWARFSSRMLYALMRAFAWLTKFMVASPAKFNKQFIRRNANLSVDELSQALELTRVEAHDEKEMLEGIIRFGDKTVSEIMTARIDITDVEIHVSFKELLDVVIESGYSRLPVYDTGEDNMKGIIYSKDLLPYRNESADFEWQKLMRRAYFVPEAKMIDDLLEEFRTKKIHMAIVVDEFGGTSGIVTMEDILEEIVGDINDEYDDDKKQYVKLPDGSFIFDAKILLNDFYKVTGLDEKYFADKIGDSETLAGLILGIKEDFPREKEHIRYAGCDFLILEVDKRRIAKVKLSIIPDEA